MAEIIYGLSTIILGVFVGTQIAEGALFVPYWKSMEPEAFFELHKTFGPKIYRFFAPITIAATVVPLTAGSYALFFNTNGLIATAIAAFMALLFFTTYGLFFKKANQAFADRSITDEELPFALEKWGQWHWARVFMEIIAFIASVVALVQL